MKFKLDENFGVRTQRLFQEAGHDVKTVRDQKLQGCNDNTIYEVCTAEKRCLVTLDLDFSNVLGFPLIFGTKILLTCPPGRREGCVFIGQINRDTCTVNKMFLFHVKIA